MKIHLKNAKSLLDWLKVYRLYREAFPSSERKPFSVILKMSRNKKTDVWCMMKGTSFKGFATTINSREAVLLDYLAVEKSARGQGAGRETLAALMQEYSGRGMFVEIESAFEPGDDQALRRRRRQFYMSAGMEPFGVMANVFGVKMELLGKDCHFTFKEYQQFYRTHYSAWAAEHLSEEVHPENP